MNDVNMSSLICDDDIIKELEQFNVKLVDSELLTRLKNICLIYDFTADKLVSEWLGFCNKKTWSTDLDMVKVELFENEGFRQEKLKLEAHSKETKFKSDNSSAPIQVDADMLNEYGVTISDDQMKMINKSTDVKNDAKTNGQVSNETIDQTNDHSKLNNGQLNITSNGVNGVQKDCVLENKLNETVELATDQTQCRFGEPLNPSNWINSDETKFEIRPLNPELHITKPYKSVQIKAHEANEILNESIDEMCEQLTSQVGEELGVQGDSLFIGRVNLENPADQKQKVLLLENPRLFQRKLRLDLSKLASYSLFPGKIVCFEGEIQPETSNLIVNKFFDNQMLLPPFKTIPANANDKSSSVFIMTASGPISPSMSDDLANLEHLLEQVQLFQPHFLILLGPFFDCRNDYLLFNCDGESFFNKIMKMISSALEFIVTEAIIVPSTFDLNNYNIFPAPPFEHCYPKIKFMPNPSFLDLNGVIIALSSVDIIRHVIREEIRKVDNNDQDRICEHLLIQKSLYPLYPPNQEVNLEYSKLDFIKFSVRPHLFIIPSMIKNFVKNVHGSLFVNPEYLSKRVYTKIKIDLPSTEHTGSIDQFIQIEIVKNKSQVA